ncbi:MAG: hypothetical protein K2G11_09225, partial [Muribaculaceae bacterium]|nr:hypothetical protein [Muribaculaceae bacterium]
MLLHRRGSGGRTRKYIWAVCKQFRPPAVLAGLGTRIVAIQTGGMDQREVDLRSTYPRSSAISA